LYHFSKKFILLLARVAKSCNVQSKLAISNSSVVSADNSWQNILFFRRTFNQVKLSTTTWVIGCIVVQSFWPLTQQVLTVYSDCTNCSHFIARHILYCKEHTVSERVLYIYIYYVYMLSLMYIQWTETNFVSAFIIVYIVYELVGKTGRLPILYIVQFFVDLCKDL
jgi:hypothetical protein